MHDRANQAIKWIPEIGVVVLLVVGSFWLGQIALHNHVTHPEELRRAAEPRFAPVRISARTLDGAAGDLRIHDRQRPLLLLVLSTDCPFCKQNMPNWRRIVQQVEALGETAPEVLVLSVSSSQETSSYLTAHGIDVPALLIERSELGSLDLTGFPSTVAIVPAARSVQSWPGVLNDVAQETILAWAEASMVDNAQQVIAEERPKRARRPTTEVSKARQDTLAEAASATGPTVACCEQTLEPGVVSSEGARH